MVVSIYSFFQQIAHGSPQFVSPEKSVRVRAKLSRPDFVQISSDFGPGFFADVFRHAIDQKRYHTYFHVRLDSAGKSVVHRAHFDARLLERSEAALDDHVRTRSFPKGQAGNLHWRSFRCLNALDKELLMQDRIQLNPNICHGKPVIEGTRVLVSTILGALAETILRRFLKTTPPPSKEDILAALKYESNLTQLEGLPCQSDL